MGSAQLDELAPRYMREDRIDVTLDSLQVRVAALESVLLSVSYQRTLPEGVVLPLIFEVQGPSPSSYQRRVYSRVAPTAVIFTPREGGTHLVVIRENAHNRWFGKLRLDVEGETIERIG